MNIKKVAVLGAGAVGSYVIWGLSNNKNITLGVVADGERNEQRCRIPGIDLISNIPIIRIICIPIFKWKKVR